MKVLLNGAGYAQLSMKLPVFLRGLTSSRWDVLASMPVMSLGRPGCHHLKSLPPIIGAEFRRHI